MCSSWRGSIFITKRDIKTKLERGTCALIYPFSLFLFFTNFPLSFNYPPPVSKINYRAWRGGEKKKKARIKRVHARKFFPQIPPPFFLSLVIGLNLDGLNHAPAPRFPSSFSSPPFASTPPSLYRSARESNEFKPSIIRDVGRARGNPLPCGNPKSWYESCVVPVSPIWISPIHERNTHVEKACTQRGRGRGTTGRSQSLWN